MLGTTISHYRILEKLGGGGMGAVYRARDERLSRDVALKVLPAGTLADDTARSRFRREALTLSQLNHPYIAVVHDFDTEDGMDFLVMEYVAGESLAAKLAAGPLPEKEVVALGTQIAEALEEAYQHSVIHRDLKPGNVMVTAKGRVKVLDFGLAKFVKPTEVDAATASLAETQAGAVMGTVPYMAPEQLQGKAVDARADIYALGAVLYEMATGRRPFPEKQATQLIAAILSEPAQPPRELNGRVSPGLEAIILKALEKDPARRYQSAKELREDVERLSSTGRVAARRSALRRHWTLAEAHIDAADEEFAAHWNWAKAEEEFRHAVELNPGSSDAQLHYAICLWALRRYDEALPVMEHARQLDPLSPYVNALLAGLLRDSHQDERAIEQYRKMLDLDPKARSAWFGLAIVYADLGRNQESVAAFVKGAQLSGESPERIKALEQALKAEGPRSFWQVQLEQQKKEAPGAPGLALGYASIYARLGEKDHAMEWLERAYAERWPLLCWVNANRVWDPLRSAPRFQDLLRRMNFPP